MATKHPTRITSYDLTMEEKAALAAAAARERRSVSMWVADAVRGRLAAARTPEDPARGA